MTDIPQLAALDAPSATFGIRSGGFSPQTTHGLLIARLLEAGWPVYAVNPRTVDRRRSALGAKTDRINAYLLAKTGRADLADLHHLTPDNEKIAERKMLTRDQVFHRTTPSLWLSIPCGIRNGSILTNRALGE